MQALGKEKSSVVGHHHQCGPWLPQYSSTKEEVRICAMVSLTVWGGKQLFSDGLFSLIYEVESISSTINLLKCL